MFKKIKKIILAFVVLIIVSSSIPAYAHCYYVRKYGQGWYNTWRSEIWPRMGLWEYAKWTDQEEQRRREEEERKKKEEEERRRKEEEERKKKEEEERKRKEEEERQRQLEEQRWKEQQEREREIEEEKKKKGSKFKSLLWKGE